MNLLTTDITIEAPPLLVFRYLTEGELLLEWMAVEATAEPVSGGAPRWRHENGATMVGCFVEVEVPSRVVFRYGWENGAFGLPPEASLVEIDLEDLGGRTRLHLRQTMLPPDSVEAHRYGWNFFLGKLAKRLADPPVI